MVECAPSGGQARSLGDRGDAGSTGTQLHGYCGGGAGGRGVDSPIGCMHDIRDAIIFESA